MRKTPALLLSGLAAALALAAAPAMAQSKGDWTFGVGLHNVAPKSDNGSLDATALGLAGYPKMAGAAASLMGFVQMGLGAGAGMLVGHGVQHGTAALGLTVAAGMLFALAAWSRSPAR